MPPFCRRAAELLEEGELREIQLTLVQNPNTGAVIPGCGGLRKLRWGSMARGKGRRGGYRVIYLNHPEVQRVDLVAIYGKDEKDDLTAEQKKQLYRLVETAKHEAKTWLKSNRPLK